MNVPSASSLCVSVSYEQPASSSASAPALEAKPTPIYSNPQIAQDSFLAKAKQFCDDGLLLCEKWFKAPLPKLDQTRLIACVNLLASPRVIKGRDNAFEVNFTLSELFDHLLSKGDRVAAQWIESVDLVGGAVPWILNDYIFSVLSEMGVENPGEWVSEEIMKRFARQPGDVDFRIYAPQATFHDIQTLRDSIIEFLVEKKAKDQPGLDKQAFQKLVFDTGFMQFTRPVPVDGNLMSTVAIKDHTSKKGIDLVIYQQMKRSCFCIRDSLRIPFKQLIDALKTRPPAELIQAIQAKTYNPEIIPCSNIGSGRQALFDKAAGLLRTIDPGGINCAGWPLALIGYLKGERSFSIDLDMTLLGNIRRTLEGLSNEIDMPPALHARLILIPAIPANLHKRMAIAAAYWLEKAILAHIGKYPQAAIILTLQACLSLRDNGYAEAVDELWQQMKGTMGTPKEGVAAWIQAAMNTGPNAFPALISLLEAKAFLFLNANHPKEAPFSARMIMHKQQPAIQAFIDGIPLLLPYAPVRAIGDCLSGKPSEELKGLVRKLQPESPYVKNTALPELGAVSLPALKDLSCPWQRLAVEWLLAAEVQCVTTHGSALLEQVMPDFLSHLSMEEQRRILRIIDNKVQAADEHTIYKAMRYMCGREDYATVPVQVKWALALTNAKDPARCRTAHALWQKYHAAIIPGTKAAILKIFVKQLSPIRPDLAAEVVPESAVGELSLLLKDVKEGYEKNPTLLNKKGILAISATIKKIYQSQPIHQVDGEMMLWIMEELINQGEYLEAYALTVMELLRKEKSIEMQIRAVKIYVERGLDIQAEQILIPLLQHGDLKGKEAMLLPSLLQFFSRLSKAKQEIALQMLSASGVGAVFKQDPKSSLDLLFNWHAKNIPHGTPPSKLDIQLYHHVFALCSLPTDAPRMHRTISGWIKHVASLDKLAKHADLRIFLVKYHDQIVKVLEGSTQELYLLLTAAKRLSLNISYNLAALDSYYTIFLNPCMDLLQSRELFLWLTDDLSPKYLSLCAMRACLQLIHTLITCGLEQEAQTLVKGFTPNVKRHDLKAVFADSLGLHPAVSRAILEQAAVSDSKDVKIAAARIFWDFFIQPRTIHKNPKEHARSWKVFVQSICKSYPEAYLMVFQDVSSLKAAIDAFDVRERDVKTVALLTGAAAGCDAIGEESRPSFLHGWQEATASLAPYVAPHYNEIHRAEIKLSVFAGNAAEREWGHNNLLSLLKALPEVHEEHVIAAGWLAQMFKIIPQDKVVNIVHNETFQNYLAKILRHTVNSREIPFAILDLLETLFIMRLTVDDTLKLFDAIMTPPLSYTMVNSCFWICLDILKRDITPENREKCLSHLAKCLLDLERQKIIMSFVLASKLTKPPLLDVEMVDDDEVASHIFIRIITCYFNSIDTTIKYAADKDLWISSRLKSIELCKNYFPSLLELHQQQCCDTACTILGDLWQADEQTFKACYREFLNFIYKTLQAKFDSAMASKWISDIRFCFIKKMLEFSPDAVLFKSRSDLIRSEFMALIESKNVDASEFQSALHEYAFSGDLQSIDENSGKITHSMLQYHQLNVYKVICGAKQRNLMHNVVRLFQYHMIYNLPNPKGLSQLPSTAREEALKEMMDQFLSSTSVFRLYRAMSSMQNRTHYGFLISPETLIHYWNIIIKRAAVFETKDQHEEESFLGQVVKNTFELKIGANPQYHEACFQICQTVLEVLCNPKAIYAKKDQIPATPLQICHRTADFLKTAYVRLLLENIDIYYRLIEDLLLRLTPSFASSKTSLKAINQEIYALIIAARSKPGGMIQSVKMMTDWVALLSTLDRTLAGEVLEKAISEKIFNPDTVELLRRAWKAVENHTH